MAKEEALLYAHTNPDCSDTESWQTLENHLNNVADLASSFAASFGMAEWGRTLGLLHDAGKASGAFQRRLMGANEHVDHSTAGAHIAIERYGEAKGLFAAYCLVGHHGGQPNGIMETHGVSHGKTPLEARLNKPIESYDAFSDMVAEGVIALPSDNALGMPLVPGRKVCAEKESAQASAIFSTYVLNRMLFSALVDADYLDTERFMSPAAACARVQHKSDSIDELIDVLDEHLGKLAKTNTSVNRARQDILADCVEAASREQGMFSLTVPTGGGKTLSSLAFALRHAARNGMSRVVIAIPFVSIVEQTACTLKEIFGANNVLEHHSNYDFSDIDEEEGYAQRLTAQNWDAPIIVTTNVQLLESLYANKPGKSRKLHNVANSVIVLDEAQTLPDSLLLPSLAMLEELTFSYNTSVVLCTATQPALGMLWPFGSQPREISRRIESFSEAFEGRVVYEMLGMLELDQLVGELVSSDQVLCIVGTKRAAQLLYDELVKRATAQGTIRDGDKPSERGYFHLSAFMTPWHRSEVLSVIRERLRKGLPCVVIATQLIEAGVDVDFPVVYRELAGMDSLVQAAGRCNREGKREAGSVFVFELSVDGGELPTSPWLDKMKGISRDVIRDNGGVVDISLVEPFFVRRYQTEHVDEKGIFAQLSSRSILEEFFRSMPFEQVAHDYRIIEDDGMPLFVPFGSEAREALRILVGADDPAVMAMKLQPHSLSAPRWLMKMFKDAGCILEVGPFSVLREDRLAELYKDDIGLVRPCEEKGEALFM